MEIWTDGACHPNPGKGGWGYVRSDGIQAYGGEIETTNNRMEMIAILEALRSVDNGCTVLVYSDSQYCVNGLTVWRNGWKRKNWMRKDGPMINRDLWLALEVELGRVSAGFKWVKGHAGNVMNEKADELASIGRARVSQADGKQKSGLMEAFLRLQSSGKVDPCCDEMADLEAEIMLKGIE